MGDEDPGNWLWDHVQIYAGNNTWYNAGSTSAIRQESPYTDANWDRGYWIAIRLVGTNGKYEPINDGYRIGKYTSSSGRVYTEWQQGAGEVGKYELFETYINSEGKEVMSTMANQGCGVYGSATLVSSVGIDVHISEVYDTYKATGSCMYPATMDKLLKKYGVNAKVCSASGNEKFMSILSGGRGILVYVGPKYNNLYTQKMHWIVVADIRVSQLGSTMGYDVYVLPSGKGPGQGWHEIETVVDNLLSPIFYYIDD